MKKKQFVMKLALILAMVLLSWTDAFAVMKGDIDGSGGIDLRDVVLGIQICAGMSTPGVKAGADVNADGQIGLADTLFAVQFVAGKMKLWYKDTDGDRVSGGTSVFAVDRPVAAYWYEETELFGISGDPDDSDSNVFGPVAPEIAIVESFIQKSGADWVAEVNPVSLLPDEERVMLLGALLPDAKDATRIRKYFSKRQHRTLPSSFDWQNGNFVTPVKKQEKCGSCWAFAATAALESQVMKTGGSSGTDLSEQIVLSCSDAGTCAGGYIDGASDFLRTAGTSTETCYSYTAANGNCGNACADWRNNASRIDSWDWVSAGETAAVSDIKNAIYENGPLVSVLYVYEDFFFYRSGVYSYAWGKQKGGHAVVITGWDDATSSFTVKNSWGTSWGESGYFRIEYSELAGRTLFGTWTIAYHSGNCTYSISPASNSFSSTAGTGSVSVTAQSGCNWTADSSAIWITLTSGSNGGGSGTVSYSVASNSGTSSRTGTVTIAEQTFTVIQSGATTTTTTVKPTTTTLPTTTTTVEPTTTSTTRTTTTTTTIPNGDYTNSLGMSFRLIPAGTFTMGSPEDEPGRESDEIRHQVTLAKSFYMQTTEVTQGQWRAVTGTNPSHFQNCGDNCPIEMVSWNDVQIFIAAMNGRGEGTYRLPTEAEWEYTARAGTSTPFYFGQCLSTNQGNYDGNYPLTGCSKGEYREEVIPVASLEANAYGLYDMHGNVWEWCQDWYGAYPTGSVTDPGGPGSGSVRISRGGSLLLQATLCRSANRNWSSSDYRAGNLGFRLVRTLPTTTTTVKPTTTSTTTTTTTTTTIPNGDYTNSLGMSFRLIPAGTFTMGSPESEPGWLSDETQHQVTLTKSFYMQTTEVTQGQWKAVMGTNPSWFSSCGDNCPVEQVSWDDVQNFIAALNRRGEGTYRLPTEAEWEYAARAGTSTPFYFGQCLSTNQGNYDGNYPLTGCSKGEYREEVIPVASLEANAYGLYDMHGNVWEWCQDWYGAYPTGSVTDPGGPGSGSYRVVRGGSWENLATRCRSADRGWLSPATRDHALGFRLVRTQ